MRCEPRPSGVTGTVAIAHFDTTVVHCTSRVRCHTVAERARTAKDHDKIRNGRTFDARHAA
jgi:hypothetical protein